MKYNRYKINFNITDFLQWLKYNFSSLLKLLKTKRGREATNQHRNNKRKIISISFLFNQPNTKNNNSVIIPFL